MKKLQKEIQIFKIQLNKSLQKSKSFKARLANAQKSVAGQSLNMVTKNMSLAGRIFTGVQYKLALKAAKRRRFTLEEKIMALTFFKKTPKCYTHFYNFFKLPSSKTLRILLSQIKIGSQKEKIRLFMKRSKTLLKQ